MLMALKSPKIKLMKLILRRSFSNKLRVCVIGKPNVGKSTLFNHLSYYSTSDTLREAESLVHPEPGLTRDCRQVQVKGVLPVPIGFHDTPGINFLIDRVRVRGVSLDTFGKLFSFNLFDDLDKDSIWEFATFLEHGPRSSKKSFRPWQKELLNLIKQRKHVLSSEWGILEHLLSPEKPISELLHELVFNSTVDSETPLTRFALGQIVENVSSRIEESDLILFMMDAKADVDFWDLHLANWIKFIVARQEIAKMLNQPPSSR